MDKSTKFCMWLTKGSLIDIRRGAMKNIFTYPYKSKMAAIFGIVGYESMIKRAMTLHCALHFQLQRGKQTQDGSATLVIQAYEQF